MRQQQAGATYYSSVGGGIAVDAGPLVSTSDLLGAGSIGSTADPGPLVSTSDLLGTGIVGVQIDAGPLVSTSLMVGTVNVVASSTLPPVHPAYRFFSPARRRALAVR